MARDSCCFFGVLEKKNGQIYFTIFLTMKTSRQSNWTEQSSRKYWVTGLQCCVWLILCSSRLFDTQAKLTGLRLSSRWNCGTSSSSLAVSVNNHKKMFSPRPCSVKLDLTDKLEHCPNTEEWGLFSTNQTICLSHSDLVRLENAA